MNWQQKIGDAQNVVIYRNGPPNHSGGAVKVIADLPVKAWVSPQQVDDKHPPIADEVWSKMNGRQRAQLEEKTVTHCGKNFLSSTFRVPNSLQDMQYNKIANGLIWPIFHSTDATAVTEPLKLAGKDHRYNYHYRYEGDPDRDYFEGYLKFNELGIAAMEKLRAEGKVGPRDKVWVHDYQCVNVPGDIYTQHIPFPPLSFLKRVTVNGKPLLDYAFFRDFVKQMAGHSVMTFQRPVDMKNFIQVLAAIDPKFTALNRGLVDGQGWVKGEFAINQSVALIAFGNPLRILNVPVGLEREAALRDARESRLDRSFYNVDMLARAGIDRRAAAHEDGEVALKDVIAPALQPGHRVFLAAHRNDYSKSTLEKLIAASNYLGSLSPEERKNVHFVYFLQPTRPTVKGYADYQRDVEALARGLRNQFGESIIVVPDKIDSKDYMGLMRHPNTVALLGIALKDGHDLTLREAASVRSDMKPGDRNAALAIVTTDGTGASDILRGSKQRPGAFVIDRIDDFKDFVAKLEATFREIDTLARTGEGRDALAARYRVCAEASKRYSPEHFRDRVLDEARQVATAARSA